MNVDVAIAGRRYTLTCREGEADHLRDLAAHLDAKAAELGTALGTLSEPRLLLMAGLLVADELFELRAAPGGAPPDLSRLAELTARAEALAAAMSDA